ncbi:MAG: aminotransferase class I/II-fold pyridoxal phosphate-dependent enzyme [Chlorobi bacterium]|nr:aminotransferase class I/II-fold pyridoxal phosphate-dependent enzyme [Chlorobiota bacterium]
MRIQKANRLTTVKEYYFSQKLKEIQRMREAGREVLNLGIGSPDLPPDEKAVYRLLDESLKKDNHSYQSYLGIPELRESFSGWYEKYFNVELETGEVLPLMGSKEGIMHISMAFLNPGDKVLIPDPGYPTYAAVTGLTGATAVRYDLNEENNWYPDLREIEKQDLSDVKLMWVNYPNMPTGVPGTRELFQDLVDFGLKYDILIINDNPYSFVLHDEQLSILSARNAKEIALELNSLSKSHNMAGWRIGMVAGHEEYIRAILRVKSNMDSGMFKPLQLAAAEALKAPRSWYDKMNETYRQRRQVVYEILDLLQFGYDKNRGGMFVWAKVNSGYRDAEHFSDALLESEGVFITPGSVFGSNGKQHVRISLCSTTGTFEKARGKILHFMENVDTAGKEEEYEVVQIKVK